MDCKKGGSMKELELQVKLKELLTQQFKLKGQEVKILQGNEFKNISTHWAEKPDLVLFHNIDFKHPTLKSKPLQNPVGIEFKNADKLDSIITGIVEQLQGSYHKHEYLELATKQKFKLNSLCFTTTDAIKHGVIYKRNFAKASLFFIERFCWKGNTAVLYNYKQSELIFSFRNANLRLNGTYFIDYNKEWD